jgi:hypothetical protein
MTAALLPVMALLMWQLPFRVVYQNASERVDLADVRCYKLGENESSLLLHCPDVCTTAQPRRRPVQSDTSIPGRGRKHLRRSEPITPPTVTLQQATKGRHRENAACCYGLSQPPSFFMEVRPTQTRMMGYWST